ncbi:MAG: restriction endonuclease subunit S [Fimbriimonadaceae bacterium]|nr:restriction endonuclease subunit S [Fimbriimonadaceae bacterium]
MSPSPGGIDVARQQLTVEQVFRVWGGGTPATGVAEYWHGSIPWATSADLDDDFGVTSRKFITPEAVASSATHVVPKEALLVATRVGLGKVGIATQPTAYSQDCQGLVPKLDGVVTRFAAYQLKLRTQEFRHISRGTTIAGVTKKQLLDIPFALPKPAVQQKIADELDLQFSRLDAAIEALKRAQENLKRYRASVLQAAVTGRLVPTEHELAQAEGRDYETGPQLLTRILVERKAAGTGKGKAKLPRSCTHESGNEESQPSGHWPNGWCCTSVGQVAIPSGGITKNAKRRAMPIQVPYLRVGNVYANEVRLDRVEKIGVTEGEITKCTLSPGDLLVVEGNGSPDQIGRVAQWRGEIEQCLHQNHLIRLRPNADSKWILYYLLSPLGRREIERVSSSSSGLHTLSIGKVAALSIPLPPLAEQIRIVAEVERRLSVADQMESTLTASLTRATRLRQAILKRAFSFGDSYNECG